MEFGKLWQFVFVSVLLWSLVHPFDGATWIMEALPAILIWGLLLRTRSTFKLTPLLYLLILLHSIVLLIGAKYSYARVPLVGEWAMDLGLQRNPYDGIGHFMQGFVPAIAAREILLRKKVVKDAAWLFFIIFCICLAISAVYELIEWAAALILGQGADEFLGTQGDFWDTQKDMFFAGIGASSALILLKNRHNRELQSLK